MQNLNKDNTTSRLGLVISYFGNSVAVEDEHGEVYQCHLRRNQPLPVVGDQVNWQFDSETTGVILSILPRRSQLMRGAGRGKEKLIAANIDVLIIVMAPPPVFSDYLLDRYLVAAELLKLKVIIVLNKIDLLKDDQVDDLATLSPYERIHYDAVMTSALTKRGIDDLGAKLKNQNGVLVGPSGVGKSSIIMALSQDENIRVNEVSDKGVGKHTTTATRLYHLSQGGNLIDSPGVREFNLWSIDKSDLLRGFKEFQLFANQCKFRDCQHIKEPGCAIQQAVLEGKVSASRYENYKTLMSEFIKTSPYDK